QHLAPHGCSNGLALALALVLFGRHTISLRLALALARIGWHTVSLRLALAPARFGHRGSRPLHLSAAKLLQLGGQRAHGMQVELFDPGSGRPRPAVVHWTRGGIGIKSWIRLRICAPMTPNPIPDRRSRAGGRPARCRFIRCRSRAVRWGTD